MKSSLLSDRMGFIDGNGTWENKSTKEFQQLLVNVGFVSSLTEVSVAPKAFGGSLL